MFSITRKAPTTSFISRMRQKMAGKSAVKATSTAQVPALRSALKSSHSSAQNAGSVADVYSRATTARAGSLGQKSGEAAMRLLETQVFAGRRMYTSQTNNLMFAHVAYPAGTPGSVVGRPIAAGARASQVSSAVGLYDGKGTLHVFAWVSLSAPTQAKAKVRFADA